MTLGSNLWCQARIGRIIDKFTRCCEGPEHCFTTLVSSFHSCISPSIFHVKILVLQDSNGFLSEVRVRLIQTYLAGFCKGVGNYLNYLRSRDYFNQTPRSSNQTTNQSVSLYWKNNTRSYWDYDLQTLPLYCSGIDSQLECTLNCLDMLQFQIQWLNFLPI